MARKVFLHAGAHRTGTSSFQNCLAANRAALEADGFDVSYPGRDGAPGGKLRLKLPQPRHGAPAMAGYISGAEKALGSQVTAGRDALVLSEENIPGTIIHFIKGRLYPARAKRAKVLREGLDAVGGEVAQLVFVIRPYDRLFVSGYRKHAEDNPIAPFAEFAGEMSRFMGGWPETVAALRDELKPQKLTVVEYGARGESRALLARLLERDARDFVEPERDLNTSATDAAMEALQAWYRKGEKLKRAEWQAVIAEHAGNGEDRGFARFETAQRDLLSERYSADLERLRRMDGVALIE